MKALVRVNWKMKRRLGENIYMIMAIMAVLLVFSGLVVGLLGRGWASAWILVGLGVLTGFFPLLAAVVDSSHKKKRGHKRVHDASSNQSESDVERVLRREEERRQAIEFEAILARQRLRRQEEERQKEQEAREALLRQEEIRKLLKEAKKKNDRDKEAERERQKRRQVEEARAANRAFSERRKMAGKSAGTYRTYGQEYQSRNVYKVNNGQGVKNPESGFSGVKTYAELKKRYRELLKQYHPDNNEGDVEMFQKIRREYEELERFFKTYERHV